MSEIVAEKYYDIIVRDQENFDVLEYNIIPTQAAFAKLGRMIAEWDGHSTIDILWDNTLTVDVIEI